ncbi:MAG: pseudouridine synthase [Gammaproteobacteria bacterium]|nr:pseudouridine synthase [Gammaproteobacteria bacterium]
MTRLILLNKPFDVLSQFTDSEKRKTLADYIPLQGFYPAGRLDRDSEGLLLLTDDGQLQHVISHPKHKLAKTYWVQVEREIDEIACQKLRTGVELNDGPARAIAADLMSEPTVWERDPPVRFRKDIPTSWLRLVIDEGRNRQVRRMTAAVGFPTLRLIRYAIGDWTIEDIAPGTYHEVEPGAALLGKIRSKPRATGRLAHPPNKPKHTAKRLLSAKRQKR